MRFVLVPLAGYLLLYAPGHFLLRRAPSDSGEVSRLLREVLLSACCTSWVGFLLAELGCFSLPLLLALLAAVAGGAGVRGRSQDLPTTDLATTDHRRSPLQRFNLHLLSVVPQVVRQPLQRLGYGRRDAIGLAVWLFACVWLAPPLDTRLAAGDSTGYLASGVQLARHGTLVMHDPTLAHLSVDLKRALFPSVAPERGAPPYLRINGSLLLRSLDSDEVLPAFHHLITVWIAAADALAGRDEGEWIITLFGGLSIWAIVECAALVGASMALVLPLLLLSAIQYWYSRFLMPEVAGQFFLWAGLACVASGERSGRRSDAALAGLAFGIAGLMRAENVLFLLVTLAMGALLVPPASRRRYALLLGCAAVVWVHAGIHLAVFRTHYFGILRGLFSHELVSDWLPTSGGGRFSVGLLVVLLIATVLLRRFYRSLWARWSPRLDHGLLAGLLLIALWGSCHSDWSSLRLLVSGIGLPTLAGGGLGMVLLARHRAGPRLAGQLLVLLAALVFAQVMIAPHAQPIPIWVARRAVTVVLPAACVGLALLCPVVAQRWHWTAGALFFCAGLLGEGRLFWQLRSEVDYYRGAGRHVQAIAALIEPGATLLIDSQLVATHLAPTLWAQHDVPGYILSAEDSEGIAKLTAALDDAPLYWVSNSGHQLPRGPGFQLTPVALYEFVLTTPQLDVGKPLGAAAGWELPIALYRLRNGAHKE